MAAVSTTMRTRPGDEVEGAILQSTATATTATAAPSSAGEASGGAKPDEEGKSRAGGDDPSSVIPRRNCDYACREYWEDRFAQEDQYDWLLTFDHLRSQVEPLLLLSSASSSRSVPLLLLSKPDREVPRFSSLVAGTLPSPLSCTMPASTTLSISITRK
jgi:hypothetical protein